MDKGGCKICGSLSIFGQHRLCGPCYVDDKVDGVMDILEERFRKSWNPSALCQWKWRQLLKTRAMIAHSGGKSGRRDARLQKQIVELITWLDGVLEEHPDEQEWVVEDN